MVNINENDILGEHSVAMTSTYSTVIQQDETRSDL